MTNHTDVKHAAWRAYTAARLRFTLLADGTIHPEAQAALDHYVATCAGLGLCRTVDCDAPPGRGGDHCITHRTR